MGASADLPHVHVAHVVELDGDPAALGGAVTAELCGHWEHEGDCRWPHRTDSAPDGDQWVVTVRFDASDTEVGQVRDRIDHALSRGQLTAPDGSLVRWVLLRSA